MSAGTPVRGPGGLEVRGGVGSFGALLEELEAGALVLLGEAAEVESLVPLVLALAVDPSVVTTALAGLVGTVDGDGVADTLAALRVVATVEGDVLVLAGPGGLTGAAGRLGGTGLAVGTAVRLYREADAAVESAADAARDGLMDAVGVLTPLLLVGAGGAVLAGVDVPEALDRLAFAHPEVVDTVAGGLDGWVRGLARVPGMAVVLAAGCLRARTPWPPRDEEEALAVLAGVAGTGGVLDPDLGVLDESGARVTVECREPVLRAAPTGLADLMADEVALGERGAEATVRVVEVPQADGSSAWILELPGTQAWDPRAGDDPFDLTTDVVAMTGEATLAAAGAAAALDAAMRRRGRLGRGDPVMLVGHSQGGILAAALASDADFRAGHRVTDVVAFGAPVSRFPVPRDVRVLAVEHVQDPVPRLDGAPDPERRTWVTVRRDLAGELPAGRASETHRGAEYARTAGQLDSLARGPRAPEALREWSAATATFLGEGRTALVTDSRLTREWQTRAS